MTAEKFIDVLNDPRGTFEEFANKVSQAAGAHLILCMAGTETSDIAGVSAAGATPADRRLTPALDAEALTCSRTFSAGHLPVSPRGIVSPVVLTRAAEQLLNAKTTIVDCGCFVQPKCLHVSLGARPARCVTSGKALELAEVERLHARGRDFGRRLRDDQVIVVGECVPGGTTTAAAVLAGLAYPVIDYLSSSLPVANHELRWRLISEGLRNSGLTHEDALRNPLKLISAVGDPMQAFVTGLLVSVPANAPVVLAGGSQMLAVYALLKLVAHNLGRTLDNCFVITTKWVGRDSQARCAELASLLQAPLAISCPDFYASRHDGLRAYEEGNVKEGVGAGAMMAVSYLRGHSEQTIIAGIDNAYDQLVRPVTAVDAHDQRCAI